MCVGSGLQFGGGGDGAVGEDVEVGGGVLAAVFGEGCAGVVAVCVVGGGEVKQLLVRGDGCLSAAQDCNRRGFA